MKNSNNTTGNQTRDLPACIAVSQPTAPPRAQHTYRPINNNNNNNNNNTNAPTCFSGSAQFSGSFNIAFAKVIKY